MDGLHDSTNRACPSEIDLLRMVFQGKWRLKVLQNIVRGPNRLSQLRRTMPECSKKVLIDTLRALELLGWIKRQEYPSKLKRVEYSLAGKCEQEIRRAVYMASHKAADQRSDEES